MTPERLAKLREWVTCDPEYRDRSACLSNGQVQELLDLVDAQRKALEAADGLRNAAGTTPRGASGRPLSNLYRDVRLAVETCDEARAKTL